jgi:hypothetical protein
VQNLRWGSASGEQCIDVSGGGFVVTSQRGSASTDGSPLSYPSIYVGCHFSTCSPATNLPARVSAIRGAVSSVSYRFADGAYNAAYDIWLNPGPTVETDGEAEIMIWLNREGSIDPVGSPVGTAALGGRGWEVWKGRFGGHDVVSYVSAEPMNGWSFDVLDFIVDARGHTSITDSWYLTSIQAGFEIWSHGVGLAVNSFSASVSA